MAREKKIVLDASVAVKWFNQEKSTNIALKIRELHINNKLRIHAPDLLLFEVINALRWKPDFDEEDVKKAHNSLHNIMINFSKINLDLAIEYAFKYDLTIYDTAYMSLAKKINAQLVTAENKLYRKVNDKDFIVVIEDFTGMEKR
jgi:predicted nucleic acid-binding protein